LTKTLKDTPLKNLLTYAKERNWNKQKKSYGALKKNIGAMLIIRWEIQSELSMQQIYLLPNLALDLAEKAKR
jgi:hypothetical protein